VRAAAPARAPADASSAVADADEAALNLRVQDLEKELKDVKGVLERQNDTLVDLRARAARAGTTQAATARLPVAKPGHAAAGPWITAALALALGAMGVLYGWMRSRTPNPEVSPADAQKQNLGSAPPVANLAVNHQVSAPVPALETQTQPRPMPAETPLEATAEQPRRAAVDAPADEHATLVAAVLDGIDLETLDASYRLEAGGSLEQTVNLNTAETANLPAATMKIRVSDSNAETLPLATPRLVTAVPEPAMPADTLNADTAKLQYKSIDVDGAEHHIQMPSILREKGAFKDRRTSLVDVLKVAVEREPSRRDLRMKLLETFYAAAAVNRQGFLEVAQYLAGERGNMPNGEWEKIAGMGRQIAADSDLFAANTDPADDTDLVNCA